ncbi:phosphatidylinositol 4-phosphatase [Nematocida homosporus]|uniref:phosphatidylinositol 4-phosphatase n=1 Tax=Nematocida homosporus TaxID=1912981 RepID=UPI00221FF947|nr:phosphatidylinositol 4-phosphatase [Nematocida homosporus]KAI5185816.1 phosphatidylinositol 4-phosphatase [Nematocida homosporus]
MHSLDSGRMLIRNGSSSVLLTYLRNTTEEGDTEAKVCVVKKMNWTKNENLRGGREFYGIYGEIEANHGKYLIYIKDRKKVGELQGRNVYEVVAGETIFLSGKEDKMVYELVQEFFKTPGLFFSDLDLSGPLGSPDSKEENTDFIFNYIPLAKFGQKEDAKDAELFGVRIIQGYFGQLNLNWDSEVKCCLLSRRSWKNTGTRFCARGSDATGHAANSVETIFQFEKNKQTHSFLQIRGSIPLSWEQKINLSYKPPVKMGDPEISHQLFRKHLEVLSKRYGDVVFLTLLDATGHEEELNNIYIDELKRNKVDYYAVDYHRMMKSPEERRVFKQALQELLLKNKVIRTNCVDCLDRTNVVQSQLAKIKMLHFLNLPAFGEQGQVLDVDDYLAVSEVRKLGQLWNQNANALAMQYTGTSALKNDLTAHGVRTFRGMIQDAISSGKRYVNNNFTDGRMQEIIEILTGARHHLGNCSRGDRRVSIFLGAFIAAAIMATAYHPILLVILLACLILAGKRLLSLFLSFPSPLSSSPSNSSKSQSTKSQTQSHSKPNTNHSKPNNKATPPPKTDMPKK